MRASSIVSFIVFVAVFALTRELSRRSLAEWAALDGIALWAVSFTASLVLAALASGAVLYTARLLRRD